MVRFLVNPTAGRGKVRRALGSLRRLANEAGADLVLSRDSADLVEQGRRAAADGAKRLVVAGGDGTFHYVARGVAGTDCALGLIALGRGNDLAAALGVPSNLGEAVRFALEGPVRAIDLGRVNQHSFIGYCGVGFDSEAARVADGAPALFRGPLAYVYSVVRTLVTFKALVLKAQFDGGDFEGRAMFAVACNVSRFGGGMQIAPQARPDDGFLDLVIATQLSRMQLLRVFPKVYRGEHVDHPAVRIVRSRSLKLAVDRRSTVACDGELLFEIGREPLEASVRSDALLVVAPTE